MRVQLKQLQARLCGLALNQQQLTIAFQCASASGDAARAKRIQKVDYAVPRGMTHGRVHDTVAYSSTGRLQPAVQTQNSLPWVSTEAWPKGQANGEQSFVYLTEPVSPHLRPQCCQSGCLVVPQQCRLIQGWAVILLPGQTIAMQLSVLY